MLEFREAHLADIPGMHHVRVSVRENRLSNPDLITPSDYSDMLQTRGKGWVAVADGQIVGFSIADLTRKNIWALFVLPGFEGLGAGKQLLRLALDWAFAEANVDTLWLSTAPGTRASRFYLLAGWENTGLLPNGELRFDITRARWLEIV